MGLMKQLAEFYVGSYYWKVGNEHNKLFNHHAFIISKLSSEFPFLEPYLTVKADSSREVGPKPFLVGNPDYYNYDRVLGSMIHILNRPITPKLKLLTNRQFLSLVYSVSGNLLSERVIISKLRSYLPTINESLLHDKYRTGKRSLIINKKGLIHPTSIFSSPRSLNILQYYEPGATGTPSFSALLVKYILEKWNINRKDQYSDAVWNFNFASDIPLTMLESLFI